MKWKFSSSGILETVVEKLRALTRDWPLLRAKVWRPKVQGQRSTSQLVSGTNAIIKDVISKEKLDFSLIAQIFPLSSPLESGLVLV